MAQPSSAADAALRELHHLLRRETPFLELPGDFDDRCARYVAMLLAENERLNLTRVIEPAGIARVHLLDALAALPHLDALAPGRALDLGSGGGVPGIVLALARPGPDWTLVDSVRKKAAALAAFSADLRLDRVTVLARRAEELGRDDAHRSAYDLVTARACAALPVLAEYALPLLRQGGVLLAWKGRVADDELRAGAAAAAILGGSPPRAEPSGATSLGDHQFVTITKERATPPGYPRRSGVPARRPLG